MMFVTVVMAIVVEKVISHMMDYFRKKDMTSRLQNDMVIPGIYAQQSIFPGGSNQDQKKKRKIKDEQGETDSESMEVDEIYRVSEEQLRKQLMRSRVDLDREKYTNQKLVERHKEETDELMDKIHTLRNKTGENDEYTKILAKHKQEYKDKYEEFQKKYDEYYDKYRDFSDKYGDAMQQVANLSDTNRMMDSKIKQQAEKIRQQGDKIADLSNQLVDEYNKYEKEKKELKESYERQASRTPDTRRSTTPQGDDRDSRDASLQGEPMDIDGLRHKFDDMKEDLEQKTLEVKDLEKQLDDMKKKNADDVLQYTVMINDYGDKMTELEKKYRESSLEVTKITAEVVRTRTRCENYDRYNRELQEKLNEAKAPHNIYFTRHGEVYHGPSCAHTKDKQVNFLRKCKDCLP